MAQEPDVYSPEYQAYLRYRSATKRTAGDVAGEWDPMRAVPAMVGTVVSARESWKLYKAAQAYQAGAASQEQAESLADTLRPETFGAKVTGTALGSLEFGSEFLTSAGVGAVAKAGLKTALPKTAAKLAGTTAEKVGSAALKAGSLAAVQQGIPAALGQPGRVDARAYEMTLQVGQNEAGQLAASVGDFEAAWPRAVLDTVIEDLSEFSGGLLTRATGLQAAQTAVAKWWVKKTGGSLDDFLRVVAKAGAWNGLIGEYLEEVGGGAMRAGTSLLPEGLQLVKPGDLASAFPDLEESAAMLVAFSLFPAGAMAAQAVASRFAPQVEAADQAEAQPAAGVAENLAPSVPSEPDLLNRIPGAAGPPGSTGVAEVQQAGATPATAGIAPEEVLATPTETVAPGEARQEIPGNLPEVSEPHQTPIKQAVPPAPGESRAGPSGGEGAAPADVDIPGVGRYRRVPETEYDAGTRRSVNLARLFGHDPVVVDTPDWGGVTVGGTAYVSRGAAHDSRRTMLHEVVHAWGQTGGDLAELHGLIRRADAQGLRIASRRKLAQLRGAPGSQPAGAAVAAPRAVRREENLATYAEDLTAYVQLLGSEEGRKHIARVVRADRTLLQRLVDALRRMGARIFGGDARAKYERDLDALSELLSTVEGRPVQASRVAAKASQLLREALEAGPRAEAGNVEGLSPRFADVWHGSGAEFTEFKDEKIGTGEGNQTYGYGHYFASAKAVAEHYRDQGAPQMYRIGGKTVDWASLYNEVTPTERDELSQMQDDVTMLGVPLKSEIQRRIKFLSASMREDWAQTHTAALHSLDKKVEQVPTGKLYKVNLAPAETDYLLWDEPLSGQSEKVRAVLGQFGLREATEEEMRGGRLGIPFDTVPPNEPLGPLMILDDRGYTDQDMSGILLSRGIRGIKYKDASARGTEKESYNYVIFDPADATIEARFAPAPPVESEAFKRWFGESKVVDAEGRPLVVYHGTADTYTVVDTEGGEERAFFTSSSPGVAGGYAGTRDTKAQREAADRVASAEEAFMAAWPSSLPQPLPSPGRSLVRSWDWYERQAADWGVSKADIAAMDAAASALHSAEHDLSELDDSEPGSQNVMPVYMRILNPIVVDASGLPHWNLVNGSAIQRARDGGRDGVIIKGVYDTAYGEPDASDIYVAFSPTQIKSATGNRGTFDPSNPDIRFAPPEKKPERVPKRVTEERMEEFQATRARALAGEVEGRPDLAQTGGTAEVQAAQTAVDELRKLAGLPDSQRMLDLQRQADTLVEANYSGTRKAILDKIKNGETLTPVEVFAMRAIVNTSTMHALRTGDELSWRDSFLLNWAYRQSGTDQARAFNARRAAYNADVRGQQLVALVLARPILSVDRQLTALLQERSKEVTTDSRRAQIDAAVTRLLEAEAGRTEKVYNALRKHGYDPALITKYDWQDPAVATKLIRIIGPARATWQDKFREFLYASMLSFPYTHARNTRGNLINLVLSKHVQDMVESAVNLAVQDKDSPSFGEARMVARSLAPAMREAGRQFVEAYKYEHAARQALGTTEDVNKLAEGQHLPAIANPVYRYLLRSYSLNLLTAVDEAFKGYIGVVATAQLAYREAKSEGLKPGSETFERRMQELMSDASLAARVKDEQLRLTFQDEASGPFFSAIEKFPMKLRQVIDDKTAWMGLPVGTMLVPFVKTPLRLAREAIRRSPAKPVSFLAHYIAALGKPANYKGGSRAFVRDAADSLIASMIFLGVLSLVDDEDEDGVPIIGGAPAAWNDPANLRGLQLATRPPYTIKIGDTTYNFKATDPIAGAVAATVDAARAFRETGAESAAVAALQSILRGIKDQTYMQTVSEISELMTAPPGQMGDKGLKVAIGTFVTPWVPNILRGTLREMDENVRERKIRAYEDMGKREVMLRRLPYELTNAEQIAPPPKYDHWGRPVKRQPFTLWNGILLERNISAGEAKKGDVMLYRWSRKVARGEADGADPKAYFPSPPNTYTSVDNRKVIWDDAEYERLVKRMGENLDRSVHSASFNWEDPTSADIERFKKLRTAAYEQAKAEVLRGRR